MTLAEINAADFIAQRAELPTAFTFDSVNLTGMRTDTRQNNEMQPGGYDPQSDAELMVLLADFASAPVAQDTRLLNMGGVDYRITSVTLGTDTVTAILGLHQNT